MKHLKFGFILFLLCTVSSVMAQYDVKANYDKQEVEIKMRDGVKTAYHYLHA